jgi:hypothetical protein
MRHSLVAALWVTVPLVFALCAGCGSYPAPVQHMAMTQASVRAAQEAGAEKNPEAALHLKLAQEQLDQAKKLMDDGDNKRAEMVLGRAEVDAELAVAEAHQGQTRAQAQDAEDQVRALRQRAKQ